MRSSPWRRWQKTVNFFKLLLSRNRTAVCTSAEDSAFLPFETVRVLIYSLSVCFYTYSSSLWPCRFVVRAILQSILSEVSFLRKITSLDVDLQARMPQKTQTWLEETFSPQLLKMSWALTHIYLHRGSVRHVFTTNLSFWTSLNHLSTSESKQTTTTTAFLGKSKYSKNTTLSDIWNTVKNTVGCAEQPEKGCLGQQGCNFNLE